ncbi:MAG: CerR family C-terminal domain-containing protein [Planctomycetota bacterium]
MPTDDRAVKHKLLDTAARLFAEHGPDGVSLREIAAEAGVTHGSIRYHFETKEKLYLAAVWEVGGLNDPGVKHHALGPPPAELVSAEEGERRLRDLIHRLVNQQVRISEDPIAAMAMLRGEVLRDGGPDPAVFRRVIHPGHEHVKWLIRSIRPDIVDDRSLEILAFNIIFQCVMVRVGSGIIRKLFKKKRVSRADGDEIARHIAEVSLGGLREFRLKPRA